MRKNEWFAFMYSMNSTYSINTCWENEEEGRRLVEGRGVARIGKRVVGLGKQDEMRRWIEGGRLMGEEMMVKQKDAGNTHEMRVSGELVGGESMPWSQLTSSPEFS